MDLPYRVEYAKTGRGDINPLIFMNFSIYRSYSTAGCKKCKAKIDQGILRIAAMVQSFHHDGKDPHWFHSHCFFLKHRPASVDDIDHFEDIRYEDQQTIRDKIGSTTGILLPETSKGKKGKKRAASDNDASASNAALLNDFGIEYSKSSRATW